MVYFQKQRDLKLDSKIHMGDPQLNSLMFRCAESPQHFFNLGEAENFQHLGKSG